jgi:DNA ligase-1
MNGKRGTHLWLYKSLTISPTSVAAQGYVPQDRSKGISLRFPRFIRVREDKGIHDASDPSFIAKLWQLQEQKGGQGHKGADDGELIDYVEEEEEVEEDDDL